MPDYTGEVSATDNCTENLDISQSPATGSTVSGATNTVTLTVTDEAGNTTETSFNMEVVDNINPVITSSHSNQTVEAKFNCQASLPDYTGELIATDNCTVHLSVSQSPAPGTMLSGVTNTITLMATDAAGNTNEISFNVEVVDNYNPVIISTLSDKTIEVGENCQVAIPDYTGDLTVIDNCDEDLEISQTPAPGTIISGSSNEVILMVSDDAANSVSTSFNIQLIDSISPYITCIEDTTVEVDDGANFYRVKGTEFDPSVVSDNCNVGEVKNDFSNSSTLAETIFPIGTTTIVWTAIDNSGNKNSCSFDITVREPNSIINLKETNISLYPNPFHHELIYESPDIELKKLRIIDLTGKIVYKRKNLQKRGTINTYKLNKGIYIIKFFSDEGVYTTKIVKK